MATISLQTTIKDFKDLLEIYTKYKAAIHGYILYTLLVGHSRSRNFLRFDISGIRALETEKPSLIKSPLGLIEGNAADPPKDEPCRSYELCTTSLGAIIWEERDVARSRPKAQRVFSNDNSSFWLEARGTRLFRENCKKLCQYVNARNRVKKKFIPYVHLVVSWAVDLKKFVIQCRLYDALHIPYEYDPKVLPHVYMNESKEDFISSTDETLQKLFEDIPISYSEKILVKRKQKRGRMEEYVPLSQALKEGTSYIGPEFHLLLDAYLLYTLAFTEGIDVISFPHVERSQEDYNPIFRFCALLIRQTNGIFLYDTSILHKDLPLYLKYEPLAYRGGEEYEEEEPDVTQSESQESVTQDPTLSVVSQYLQESEEEEEEEAEEEEVEEEEEVV